MSQPLAVKLVSREEHRRRRLRLGAISESAESTPTPPQEGAEAEKVREETFEAGKAITVEFVQHVVLKDFVGVKRDEILSENMFSNVVLARQIGMYLSLRLTGKSLPEVGRRFGGKHHTTVLQARNKMLWLIGEREMVAESYRKKKNLPKETDAKLARRLVRLERKIKEEWARRHPVER